MKVKMTQVIMYVKEEKEREREREQYEQKKVIIASSKVEWQGMKKNHLIKRNTRSLVRICFTFNENEKKARTAF